MYDCSAPSNWEKGKSDCLKSPNITSIPVMCIIMKEIPL